MLIEQTGKHIRKMKLPVSICIWKIGSFDPIIYLSNNDVYLRVTIGFYKLASIKG